MSPEGVADVLPVLLVAALLGVCLGTARNLPDPPRRGRYHPLRALRRRRRSRR
ncbi:MAG TPA: hypothetical protein VIL00_04890 [Pseudonocardiaceae bacterium]